MKYKHFLSGIRIAYNDAVGTYKTIFNILLGQLALNTP